MINVAINGGGRIGLQFLKHHIRDLEAGINKFKVVLINDPFTDVESLAYRTNYDTVHGRFQYQVTADAANAEIHIKGLKDTYRIKLTQERDPEQIPCAKYDAQIMIECTGVFTAKEKASRHLKSGVKHVLISAPASGDGILTVVYGVNHEQFDKSKHTIVSNASCTTNCLAPLVKVIDDKYKVTWGTMTTTHAATATQKVVDGVSSKDFAGGRSVFNNITPASTGAAKAIGLVLPHLNGKIGGNALRVPTPNVSLCDFVCGVKETATEDDVKKTFQKAAEEGPLKGVLAIGHKCAVSMDFNGDEHSSILAPESTMCFDGGKVVKVQSFYDNENGYSRRLADLTNFVSAKL